MRTTIDIPDPVYARLKQRAELENSTVKAKIIQAVTREAGSATTLRGPGRRVRLPLIKGKQKRLINPTNADIADMLFE